MAKQRMISTRFWSDNFIVNLDIIERYVFLYLLTNEHTNMCGIYEIPLRVMSRETGIDEKELERLLENRFQEKVFYVNGWIYIKNFSKHQSSNPNMKKGAERELSEVPEEIVANINEKIKAFERVRKGSKGFESLSDYTKVIQNSTQHNVTERNLTENFSETSSEAGEASSPESNDKTFPDQETNGFEIVDPTKELEKSINRLMTVFYQHHPGLNFGNKHQRTAAAKLIKTYGEPGAIEWAEFSISIQGEQGAPDIADPLSLLNKFGWVQSKKLKKEKEASRNELDPSVEALINELRK